jgi:hypothetical protein
VRYLVLATAAMVAGCAGTAPREEIPREAGGLRSGDEVELFGEDEVCMWSERPTRLLFPAGTHAYVIGPDDGDPRPDRLVRVQVSEHYPGRLTWTGSCRRDQLNSSWCDAGAARICPPIRGSRKKSTSTSANDGTPTRFARGRGCAMLTSGGRT